MKIIALGLERFKSFNQVAVLHFEHGPGLVLVTGENKVDKRLGANGIGKTTLFDALCWVFFGKTGRGQYGPRVVTSGSRDPAIVQVWFELDGNQCLIERRQSPNRLELRVNGVSKIVVQSDIDLLLGFSYERFLRGAYHTQGATGFIMLRPQQMLDELSEYLELSNYDDARDAATRLWRSSEQVRLTSEATITSSTKILKDVDGQVDDLSLQSHEEARAKLRDARINASAVRRVLKRQRKLLGKGDARQATATQAAVNKAKFAVRIARDKYRDIERSIEAWRALLHENKCPTCGQDWDRSEEARAKLRELKHPLANADQACDVAEADLVVAERAHSEAEVFRARIADLKQQQDEVAEELIRLRNESNRIARRKNSAFEALIKIDKLVDKIGADLAESRKAYDEATKQSALSGYWRGGFKLLKLTVVKNALAMIELVANSTLSQLGMPDWTLRFDVDAALEGAGKLAVTLTHTNGTVREPTDLSFGELQRVRLATDLAIGDVCLASSRATLNIEMWDEPTTWLSDIGIDEFLRMLERRAKSLGRTILVADHRVSSYPWLDTIVVSKSKKGSRLVHRDEVVRTRPRPKLLLSGVP